MTRGIGITGGSSTFGFIVGDSGSYTSNGISNASAGSGSAHNVLQPYVTVNYIIKY